MPYKPKSLCTHPNCNEFAENNKSRCVEHFREKKRAYVRKNDWQKMYNWRWRKVRARFLRANSLCVECLKYKRYIRGTEVDHIIPHGGDRGKFWDTGNWQALCKSCHSSKTLKEKRNEEN